MSIFERSFGLNSAKVMTPAPGVPASATPAFPPLQDAEIARVDALAAELAQDRIFRNGLALYCGPADTELARYRECVARLGGNLVALTDAEPPLDWIERHADACDLVIIDAEFYGDLEATIDIALYLRRAAPGLPIIMISSDVGGDDFTAERMMACDATLKSPCNRARLEQAFRAALDNNAHYCEARGVAVPRASRV
ncbi:hypothetical protein [Pseudooceanicola aestuarii]|uniref:hypothetical protein n=1 Tax=Pseudooceanicola aestuarii TaxID=2697319 RepID=UPI0013D3EA2E|nr:hypothetical protein [Pseudooceanicola aestuarii]